MSRRAEIHSHIRQKAKLEADLLSGELKIVRPPSPGSVPAGAVKVHGNLTTMNFGNILFTNVSDSLYLKNDCAKIGSFQALVDEIYNKVENLQPFISNSGNQASSAFCLVYALFCLRPTTKQLTAMLNHVDSPYIRAIGFLFLRYATPPKGLLDWCWDYLNDDEPITLEERGKNETTIGKFVRQILTENNFLSARFPRIPVLIEKSIKAELAKYPYIPGATESHEPEEGEEDAEVDAVAGASAVAPKVDRERDRSRRGSTSAEREPARGYDERGDRTARSTIEPRRSRSRERSRDRDRNHRDRDQSRDRRSPHRDDRSSDRRDRDRDFDHRDHGRDRDYSRARAYDGHDRGRNRDRDRDRDRGSRDRDRRHTTDRRDHDRDRYR